MERNITVGFAVALMPQAIPYFEEIGIDFCCGGQRMLTEAIREKGLSEETVFSHLEQLERELSAVGKSKDFLNMESDELIDYIVSTHHAYLRRVMPMLSEYMTAVMRAHGAHHPELFEIAKLYGALRADLEQHLLKEEMFLFPAINAHKSSKQQITEYTDEHEAAGDILAKLETLTAHYTAPDDACETYVSLYRQLHEMEEDLHRHIHLENNILFLR